MIGYWLSEVAGRLIFDNDKANIYAARGIAIREFPLKPGYGFADYLLYIDGKAAGVIQAKKTGTTLRRGGIRQKNITKVCSKRYHPGRILYLSDSPYKSMKVVIFTDF